MTQTVILTQPVRVSGSVLAAGTTQTLARDIAADLVKRGVATPVGVPVWQLPTLQPHRLLGFSTIPFLIMPGDGSANGCQFTGTAGAFTLSAAILTSASSVLAECFAYFPANFGGSTLAAGWYWTKFSSDTDGIVYENRYTSGVPKRPSLDTPIAVNLTGFITAPTTEITTFNPILLPNGFLGKNGRLALTFNMLGTTGGTKTYRVRAIDGSSTMVVQSAQTTSPSSTITHFIHCVDSNTEKIPSRGSGTSGPSLYGSKLQLDTSVDVSLYFTMQGSTNTAAPIMLSGEISAVYGE